MDKIGLIDFQGQVDAQRYAQLALVASAVTSFSIGFGLQDVHLTLYLFLLGVTITFMVRCIPVVLMPSLQFLHGQRTSEIRPAGYRMRARRRIKQRLPNYKLN